MIENPLSFAIHAIRLYLKMYFYYYFNFVQNALDNKIKLKPIVSSAKEFPVYYDFI